jgi:hypothetical protein
MIRALEQVRRMRGGAQSQLMRCSDGYYYVVKFQNNPQHRRVLVNELLGTRLARRLGLPTTPVEIVEVSEELVRLTPDLAIELQRTKIPCQAGQQFGSRYPGNPRQMTLHDFLPDEQLRQVSNLHDFAGMLVFDKWTCNTNGRQTVFFIGDDGGVEGRSSANFTGGEYPVRYDFSRGTAHRTSYGTSSGASYGWAYRGSEGASPRAPRDTEPYTTPYTTRMIDQGFCFNAGEWNYPDAPLRGLYTRNRVYQGITGMESFGPWLERLQSGCTPKVLNEFLEEIPPAWYEDDYDALVRLTEQLERRRGRVPELLLEAKKSSRQPFPNWR